MKTDSTVKRFIPLIIVLVFGALLFLSVIGMELNSHFNYYHFKTLSADNVIRILSDACFVPSVFILGTALIGFMKYVSFGALLYSAFQSLKQLIMFGFIPQSCRKAYREYRKATRKEKGTGLAILFAVGLVFLALAIIFMFLS